MSNVNELTHSYSSMKMYENCPQRYYQQRVLKSVTDPGGEATKFGERVHKSLEDYIKDNTPLSEEAAQYQSIVDAVAGYTKTGKGDVFAELEMTLTKDLQPTGWWDSDAWIRSKIDVLLLSGKNAVVVDWKTGKRRPDFSQLELFALQTFAHYPDVQQVTSVFVWLKERATDKGTYTRDKAPDMWGKVLGDISRIEASLERKVWPTKPSGLCRFCPCRNFCDDART